MKEVLFALLGAIATGIVQTLLNFRTRQHESETILVALAAEIDSICRLIRVQHYQTFITEVVEHLYLDGAQASTVIVDLKENYFSVYNALGSQIGRLRPLDALKIVRFYAFCKSAIDSTRPDGVMVNNDNLALVRANLELVLQLLDAILRLGDEIVQLPKTPIHEELSISNF